MLEGSGVLQKWHCHKCEKGFLLIEDDAKCIDVHCPFCGTSGGHIEAVAGQNPEEDYQTEMGCLWPGYNEFDKICYLMSTKQISQEQANTFISARFRGEKPDIPR